MMLHQMNKSKIPWVKIIASGNWGNAVRKIIATEVASTARDVGAMGVKALRRHLVAADLLCREFDFSATRWAVARALVRAAKKGWDPRGKLQRNVAPAIVWLCYTSNFGIPIQFSTLYKRAGTSHTSAERCRKELATALGMDLKELKARLEGDLAEREARRKRRNKRKAEERGVRAVATRS